MHQLSTHATLLLAGDVMTGRGVDQILQHPGNPELRERYVQHAGGYVELAERIHGPIDAPVDPAYVWGAALALLAGIKPDASIANLETSITASDDFWPDKGVHYRMHPANLACLQAGPFDMYALANNHVLDFGVRGLFETLTCLERAGLPYAGAGRDLAQAQRAIRVPLSDDNAVSVVAACTTSAGVPVEWAAGVGNAGVHLLSDLSSASASQLGQQVQAEHAIKVVSMHWGSNWGHEIDPQHIVFAHRLIDQGVDLVHGHSSHHVRAIELYRGKLILYGCGDLITDYEGITGDDDEVFRGDIGAMYFVQLAADGRLTALRLVPMRMKALRLTRAVHDDCDWLKATLDQRGRLFGTRFDQERDGSIVLRGG